MRRKVTVVGAGMTGGTMAQRLAETGYIDVVLHDIIEGLPQGKALDLSQSAAVAGFNGRVTGTNDWNGTYHGGASEDTGDCLRIGCFRIERSLVRWVRRSDLSPHGRADITFNGHGHADPNRNVRPDTRAYGD